MVRRTVGFVDDDVRTLNLLSYTLVLQYFMNAGIVIIFKIREYIFLEED